MVERLALIVRGHRTRRRPLYAVYSRAEGSTLVSLSGVYLAGLLVSEMHGVVRVELERDRHLQH